MRFVVTGGRGFIGSHFVELCLKNGHKVIDIDKMTYAANEYLPFDGSPNYRLIKKDIKDITHIPPCDVLVNFAAESHVDNSIESSRIFMDSNVMGVHNLLELLRGKVYERPLFVHISTDEVYGDSVDGEVFHEESKLNPSNPYAASKAAAEMLVLSHARTYGIDYLITRSCNNYGERQYEEKLIPKVISCFKEGRKVPVHGSGMYKRDWMLVENNVKAIYNLIISGHKNEVFNIAAHNELSNMEVIASIGSWFFNPKIINFKDHCHFVENRLGQDFSYKLNTAKLEMTGWMPPTRKGIIKWFD